MRDFISEYGKAIYYGITSLLCLIIFFFSLRLAVDQTPIPVKTATYNSSVSDEHTLPTIIVNNSIQNLTKDELNQLMLNDFSILESKGCVSVENALYKSVRVSSSVGLSHGNNATYYVTVEAGNENGIVNKVITILMTDNEHLYF